MNNLDLEIPLKKVVKGAGIVFIGTILGTILGLITRVIVVRYITKTEYGLLSLSLVIMSILVTLSCLGFQNSVPRYISYALGKKDYSRAWATIRSSIELTIFLSIIFSLLLCFFAGTISQLFHKPGLSGVIKILAFTIPLNALVTLLVSILRGFEDVKPKVYFQNIFQMGIKIVLLGLVVFLALSFKGVLYVYLITILLTLTLLIVYARKKIPKLIPVPATNYSPIKKELILFSLPLLGTSICTMLMQWTSTLMLGYFKTADVVGLYNVALPIARLIPLALTSMVFIYLPVACELYSQTKMEEMKKLYASVTKWTFSITLPFFLCLFLAPKPILHLLFGARYGDASIALQLLALGYFVHTFLGPNGMTMVSLGRTNIILLCVIAGALSNLVLSLILIPPYGLVGASIASAFSLILSNVLISLFLFKFSKIHPFHKNYIKPIFASVISTLILFKFVINPLLVNDWHVFTFAMAILLISLGSILVTKSVDEEDIFIIGSIERKIRNGTGFTHKVLVQFRGIKVDNL